MRKTLPFLQVLATAFLFLCLLNSANAQQLTDITKVNTLVQQNASKIGLSAEDLKNYRISDVYTDKLSGATLVYLQQTYKGIDVMNAVQSLAFKNDKLMSVTGKRIDKIELKVNAKDAKASLSAADAVRAAAKHLNLTAPAFMIALQQSADKNETEFGDLGISTVSIKSKLLWVLDSIGTANLAWQVRIQPKGVKDYWYVNVDAIKGGVINKINLTVSCQWTKPMNGNSFIEKTTKFYPENEDGQDDKFFGEASINSAKYKVVPFPIENPDHFGGTPSLQANPWELAGASNNATTLKWNDDGTKIYDSTRGNNVLAQEDKNGNNGFGNGAHSSTGSTDMTFDFVADFTQQPTVTVNQNFAITNLFYWNNIMHDISYQYGFDEVSGNFQANNLSRGGLGNDYVFADAQDGSGTDNANFATPPDGSNPRMQMYLFSSTPLLFVNAPSSFAGKKGAVESGFSIKNKISSKGPITSDVILYNDDAGGTSHLACGVPVDSNALKGKIALIERGTCAFTNKVKNAQNAGAIAAIVWDNVPGESPFPMGGTDNTITIPAFLISYESGDSLMKIISSGTTVNVTMASLKLDGDVDNGVISHEYTHGISNRLTGGPSQAGCLENAEQMGEGWSDYFALMVTTNWNTASTSDGSKKRPIGNYVIGEDSTGGGIRTYPYSTDISIDPWTYSMLATNTGGEVHTVGEIWTTVLWEMTWNLIQQDGINKNIYNANGVGGNSVALKLVTEGLKLQPCSPGFIDGRDAILKADTLLFNGRHSCAIWNAFAKRGMGINASEGSSYSYTDQVSDFNVPSAAVITKTANKDSALQQETIGYTLKAKCQCIPITNYKIVDTLPSNTTWISGGTYNSTNRTVTFGNLNISANDSVSLSFSAKVNPSTYTAPAVLLNETVASTTISSDWTTVSGIIGWKVKSNLYHSSPYSFYIRDTGKTATARILTAKQYKLSGISTLSFWHYYNTEGGWDGGWVEFSIDNGASWLDINPYIVKNGYNSYIYKASGGKAGPGFSGYSGGFIQTIANLSAFDGDSIKIRFSMSCDDTVGVDGWYVDDIHLQTDAGVYNLAQLFDGSSNLKSTSFADTYIKNGTLPILWGDFSVTKQGNAALLKWQTLQEVNSASFTIERSTDGINFKQLGSVNAAGNSNTIKNYQFTDNLPLNGTDFYRIKQFDKDGSFSVSPTRSLDFLLNHLVSITPNPAKDKVAITVTGNTQPLKVYLLNALGQELSTYNMNGQYLQINLPHIAAGTYYIKITGGLVTTTQKLVIE